MYLYTCAGYNETVITTDISIDKESRGRIVPGLKTTVLHIYSPQLLCFMDTELNYGEMDKQIIEK